SMPQPEPGLTRAEVEQIVRSAIAGMPQPEPGITRAEVEQIARAAVPTMPPALPPEPSLSLAEVEQIAHSVVASIPPKSNPAEYTKYFVDAAISRYNSLELDATLAHYNSADSVDGQWYVFIGDESGELIGHYDPAILGLNLNGPLGTDATGYTFGADMLSATEDGKWVSYVFKNPATGELESKHSWVVRHDGLLFGSGWYTNPAEYTKFFVDNAISRYESDGAESAIAHYSSADSVDGQWYTFIIYAERFQDESGVIIGHYDPDVLGQNLNGPIGTDATGYNFGPDMLSATQDGKWVSYVFKNPATGELESKHSWVVRHDGHIFGSGWYTDPAEYTKYFVNNAVERYESEGLEDTLAYYNTRESIDGQWYVFVIDEDGYTISHHNPAIRGRDPSLRVDATGYFYGDDLRSATEEGKWVSYVFNNPASGRIESKHTWVVKHDEFIFGSGWYTEPAEYTKFFLDSAIGRYESEGLDATIAHYNSPESVEGSWYVYIANEDGEVISHHRPDAIGENFHESYSIDFTGFDAGAAILAATEAPKWVSYYYTHDETGELIANHAWVAKRDGLIFLSVWVADPAEYTRAFVAESIRRYENEGLEDTLAYYNSPDSVNGQWYVFIADETGELIGHYNPEIVGQNLNGSLGTDANDFRFGVQMLTANEEGKWVSYVFNEPVSGSLASKHAWVVRHDGLFFGSGWYSNVAEQ
ncbi:MAG: cache domain-containing protein, partial [Dehalococcoidia bacterium]|nr:cache domain-containing protein [Dehalococcoidia bacterium]